MDDLPDIVNIREEWAQLLDQKREYRDTIVNDDLYSTLEYLGFLDRFSKWMMLNSRELEKWANPNDKVRTLQVNELKATIDQKYPSIQDEYAMLAENTLRRCEDIVARYTDGMQRKKDNREMDKDLVLQEMKDSLEDYRVAREEYVTALDIPYKRETPDKSSLEDVGEEAPELDSILSQLDTIITSCDYALILNDVEE